MIDWEKKTDKELSDGADAGLGGQGYIAEAMRRLKVAVVAEEAAIKKLTLALVALTVVLVIVAIVTLLWGHAH